ncbi:hypothetical protein [Winogradskyella sp. A3E31]|uniref:hypothetical protein n=1 Tax=Winogradskyella sp. A3E31 TaxID=3349637 RepID=UPI00398AC28B
MNNKTAYIIKGLGLVLVIALLIPTAVKFSHIFEKHEHQVCLGKTDSHLHDFDIDCEFYKFKLSTQFYHVFENPIQIQNQITTNIVASQYHFVSDYQKLPFALRGPPILI